MHPQLLPIDLVLTVLGNAIETGKGLRTCHAVPTLLLLLRLPLTMPLHVCSSAHFGMFVAAGELCAAAGGSSRMKMQWSPHSQASSTLTRRWARAQRLKRAILCKCTTRAGSLTVQQPSNSDGNTLADADSGRSQPPQAPFCSYILYQTLSTNEITDLCSPQELLL